MIKLKFRRAVSFLMTLLMVLTSSVLPVYAKSNEQEISIVDKEITPDSKSVMIEVNGYDNYKIGASLISRSDIVIKTVDGGTTLSKDVLKKAPTIGKVAFADENTYSINFVDNTTLEVGDEIVPCIEYEKTGNYYKEYFWGESVAITSGSETASGTAVIKEPVKSSDKEFVVKLSGNIPSNAKLIVKSFPADEVDFDVKKGTDVGEVTAKSGNNIITVNNLTIGEKLVAFVLDSSDLLIAKSKPVVIQSADVAKKEAIIIQSDITTETKYVDVKVTGCDKFKGSSLLLTTDVGETTIDRTNIGSISFTGDKVYKVDISKANLTEGNTVLAQLYRQNEEGNDEYVYSNYVVVKKAVPQKTPEEILKNCSVQLMQGDEVRTEYFKQTDKSVDVKVKLDESVDGCYLAVYSYAGNTRFDADSEKNIRLWQGYVKDGDKITCDFREQYLPLKFGYKVIASLNVPVGPDWYMNSSSDSIEIVDSEGNVFKDYDYPDAKIDEKTLEPGTEKIHISLTGDKRIFDAAKRKDTSVNIAVAQYPADADFDFENEEQHTLYNAFGVTEPISGKEITLSEPLKPGYKVRAVVYWEQNVDLMLVKGNDYEPMFHKEDDSIIINGSDALEKPTAEIAAPINVGDKDITVKLSGEVPADSIIILKSFEASDDNVISSGGVLVGSANKVTAGNVKINASNIEEGKKIVAFVINQGKIIAQSSPVIVQTLVAEKDFVVTIKEPITTESKNAIFNIKANNEKYNFINAVKLYKENVDTPIAQVFAQDPGEVSLDISKAGLNEGDKVYLELIYNNAENTLKSDLFTVTSSAVKPPVKDGIVMAEKSFTTSSKEANITVTGCDEFKGGLLILTTGAASNTEVDSRTRLGDVNFTGDGSYKITFSPNVTLKDGDTILPYLYKYDVDTDRAEYKYGEAVLIGEGSGQNVETEVSIATDNITENRNDIWVITNFDPSKTGTLKIYTYSDESFSVDTANEIYSGTALPSEMSQRVTFGSNKLTAGDKIIAVLTVDDKEVVSIPKIIQVTPQKPEPTIVINDKKITEGDTKVIYSINMDRSIDYVTYKLYQFTGETVNPETDKVLGEGRAANSVNRYSIGVGGKLKVGSKLQFVMEAEGKTYYSNIVTVEPSPDWGTPTIAFNTNAVYTNAKEIPVKVDYSDEYLTMGEDFYCDVTLYKFDGSITDDDFIGNEMWETGKGVRIGQINSNFGDQTKGDVVIPLLENAELKAGEKVIAKLRLPNTEWEDEEVDYVSYSVPVYEEGAYIPPKKVILYNLDNTTSRGYRLRKILSNLDISTETITNDKLNETVGYLAGWKGYEAATSPYEGEGYSTEFMLICGLSDAELNEFLDAMTEDGLRIDHKAIVTEYNKDFEFRELIEEIANEHDVFQAILELNDLIKKASALKEDEYGSSEHWPALQEAIKEGKNIISTDGVPLEEIKNAIDKLKTEYLIVTNTEELKGTAIITIEKQDNGKYDMIVNIKDSNAPIQYKYLWSNGEKTQRITGISADKLIGTTVKVTADGMFGELKAQLCVPDAPNVTTKARKDEITVEWNDQTEKDNQPAPEEYIVTILKDGDVIESETINTNKKVFKDLKSNTNYEIRVVAVSPVGISDTVIVEEKTDKSTSSGGSGGSSLSKVNSDSTRYKIKVKDTENGSVKVDSKSASKGTYVVVNVKADDNYKINRIYVKDSEGNRVEFNEVEDGFEFKMPSSDVTIVVDFIKEDTAQKPKFSFYDVPSDAYFEDAVMWAAENGITSGVTPTLFAPYNVCTRAEIVTFLWRAAGSPKPNGAIMPFTDIDVNAYYYDAVLWAVEEGITSGTSETTFGPSDIVSRAQTVTFLWRSEGMENVTTQNNFTDVASDTYYSDAVLWAVEKGIAAGTSDTTFSPEQGCERAHIVTFLYRCMSK